MLGSLLLSWLKSHPLVPLVALASSPKLQTPFGMMVNGEFVKDGDGETSIAWVSEGGGIAASAAPAEGTVSQADTPLQAGARAILDVVIFIATEALIHVSYSSACRPQSANHTRLKGIILQDKANFQDKAFSDKKGFVFKIGLIFILS